MRWVNKPFNNRTAIRFALAGMTAALLAGCSSGPGSFGDPFSNPFKEAARFGGSDPTPTGSLTPAAPIAPDASQSLGSSIISKPLAPVRPNYSNSAFSPPAARAPTPRPEYAADNVQPNRPQHDWSGRGAPVRTAHGVWSPVGGAHIYVGQADDAAIIAARFGVPVKALLDANGLRSPSQIRPGMRVTIPVYSAAGHGAYRADVARADRPRPRPADRRPQPYEKMRFIKGPAGRPLHPRREAENLQRDKRVAERDRDARAPARSASPAASDDRQKLAERSAAPAANAGARVAPAAPSKRIAANARPASAAPPARAQVASASSAEPRFSWPARGRIIEGFKPGRNDGINIAVPDGTVVRAAASGVVAYAGDELKGYGNLVLIRHPGGYVTAYADNAKLDVKRGEKVRRGQAIAESGQSGNVSSPQLHFELRKGQTPLDPTRYLAGL